MALDSPSGLTAVMPGDTCPVQWTGRRVVATFPEQIDVSNAGQIAEELLSLINRGAAELIADMTATVSCDYAGADAVARAYRRAAVSGTQLRLVVTAPIVRRVFTVNGLDRLIPIYPWLEAAVAGTESREAQAEPSIRAITPAGPKAPGLSRPADQAGGVEELLDRVVSSIFGVGMILQAAAELPRDAAGMRIADALNHLDDVIREVRQHVLDGRAARAPSGSGRRLPPAGQERLAQAKDHAASLRERAAQTAQALRLAAADTAALLEQRADLARQPGRIDYPTEIKRWRAFADQAERMTQHWQQGE
jgi:anti-sigma B factor antagonist